MAEGLYNPYNFEFPENFPKEKALLSVVKVKPKRSLRYKKFENVEDAKEWSKWITHSDGSQTINYGTTASDKNECEKPDFSEALLSHELCEIYKNGETLPKTVDLKGNGNGILISKDGLILTNYHLVSGAVEAAKRDHANTINDPIEIHGLEIEYPVSIDDSGKITYKKAEKVLLISNPSAEYAYKYKHDIALLKIELNSEPLLSHAKSSPSVNETLFVLGFTMRTARLEENKKRYKYEDAHYDLRISIGKVLELDTDNTFLSSADGGPGNSGSLTVNEKGEIVGIYYGSTGNGIVDPSGIKRRHVSLKAAKKLFGF